ncbi:hypothetical protein SLEP1_g29379 [Rubroshorea leprosula]|uniref:Uncharacterized protein n=1 Tax=Rubroshorea leprosula TaxID=152421 RepID=A0AAV5K377_9ROSI|nr:hypothetical protein SLEP1_g29379 [Rubroshorea leprosula]
MILGSTSSYNYVQGADKNSGADLNSFIYVRKALLVFSLVSNKVKCNISLISCVMQGKEETAYPARGVGRWTIMSNMCNMPYVCG